MSMSAAFWRPPMKRPKANAHTRLDSGVLHGYAGDATAVNVNFTINTDGPFLM